LEDVVLLSADALLVDNFMELPESEGIYLSGPDVRYGDNTNSITGQSASGVLAAYSARYGEEPSAAFWAHSYDATAMLLQAIANVAVVDGDTMYIDRQALRDDLNSLEFDGLIGSVGCDQFGDCSPGLVTLVHHTNSSDIEAGKGNVVFSFAP